MRERTPSADDTPKRAPPAPPREAASADVAGSKTSSEAAEVFGAAKFSPATTASSAATTGSSPSSVDVRMVASTHNLDDLGMSHTASANSDRQQQQEKHCHTYRSAQTAQDKRSRLSNVINNLRKKVPDSRNGDSPRKEEDDRNSVERNLETLEKYVMTVLNGVIKDEEDDDRELNRKKEAEKGKEPEKLPEDQEDEDSKGPAAIFEPSKPNESRTEAAVFPSEQPDKPEAKESPLERQKVDRIENFLRNEESNFQESLSESVSEEKEPNKVERVDEEDIRRIGKGSSKETKSEEQSAQETARNDEEEKKENRSLGTIIMERLSENQAEDKSSIDPTKEDCREFVSDNVELWNVCRDLLNDLLNGINQLIDENGQEKEQTRTLDNSVEESRDSRTQDFSMTSLHCSLPLDKVASVLQNCQTSELAVPQSPSSSSSASSSSFSSQGSKSPSKPPSPTVRHLCLYCDRKFMSISLRQRHTERVHQQGGGRRSERNSRKPSQNCQYCSDKCAESLEGLFQHMVSSHGDKYHGCLQCSTRYLTREALAGHMSENHGVNVERNLQIQEKIKEPSPCKELGNQSMRDVSNPRDRRPEDTGHEHRAEATNTLLKPMHPVKDNFSNPGSPEFDSSFYSSVSCNIRENLLHHLDGKLQSSSSTVTSTSLSIIDTKPQQQPQQSFYEHNVNQIQFPIDISLTAATPVYSKEYSNEEYENNSEYAQKPGKSNRSHPRRVSFEKYNFPRKYDGKEQWTCSIKDLSKFDISTQLSLRKKQQLLKERLSLNRLRQITVLAPSEIVQDEQNLDSRSLEETDDEPLVVANSPDVEQTSRCEIVKSSEVPDGSEAEQLQDTEFTVEFGNFLRLRRWDENTSIEAAKKQEIIYAELTGEWSRPRVYICGACASKHVTLKEMEDHKVITHPNVWCSHFEFSGDQRELYKHLFLPGKDVPTTKARTAILVEKVCTKCSKNCTTLPELHRHMLECGGDQAWLLGLFGNGKKKCKWRPFGSRSRRRRQRGMKRNIQNSQTPRVNTPKEKQPTGPRVRPSDRESIQKMLANLPPKRATRKVLQDNTVRTQGRLRTVQSRTRPRMVGDNSSASRMSRNKAALRNKLLKNAKSIQRNRCRIDNISAVIESVVKNYTPDDKNPDEGRNDSSEKNDLEKETKEKAAEGSSSIKEGDVPDGRSSRTKMVRGPRVLGKRRNVKTKEGAVKSLVQMKKTTLKAKARAALKNLSETKSETSNESTKILKSTKASPKNVEKEVDVDGTEASPGEAKSLSLKNKLSTQTTPKRKRPVDPVASLNASIKAKSQLRTQDGKFARNPNKESLSPQKSPEIRCPISGRLITKVRSSETSPESSITRSKLRAVSKCKNGDQLPKRTTRLSSDSDKMPTLEPAVQVSSNSEEFLETTTNDLPILSPATSASSQEKILRGKSLTSKCLNLEDKESPKKEESQVSGEKSDVMSSLQEEEKDQKQGKGRRAKNEMKNLNKSVESVDTKTEATKEGAKGLVKEKFKRKSAPAKILNVEEKKNMAKNAEEVGLKKEMRQKKEEGKLETRSNAKAKLEKVVDDDSPIKIQNVPFEVKKLIGSDNKEDLLTKLVLTSRIATSKRCLRQPVSKFKFDQAKIKPRKDLELEKGKLDSGSISDASTKKEKFDAKRRKSLRNTDRKDKAASKDEKALDESNKIKEAMNEMKTAVKRRRSSSMSSEIKSLVNSTQVSSFDGQTKSEVEMTVQAADKRQTRWSLLNTSEAEIQNEQTDFNLKKNTFGKRRGRVKSSNETSEKKNTDVSQTKNEETGKNNSFEVNDEVNSVDQNEANSDDKGNVSIGATKVVKDRQEESEKITRNEKEKPKGSDPSENKEATKVTENLNHLQVETSNSMDSGKENSLERPAPVQKLKVGRPRKSWGPRKERASKKSLNNVIGILTEGMNVPVESQSSVLSTQTSLDSVDSSVLPQNPTPQTDDATSKTQNLDKSIKSSEDTVLEVASNPDKLVEEISCVENISEEDLKQLEVLEAASKDLNLDKSVEKVQKVESPSKDTKEQSPANDIILDLSRRKQKGKGSFLEKIVSKIAKKKDALLEGEVGSLLDTAADELTSILDEVGPGLSENTEASSEAKAKTKTEKIGDTRQETIKEATSGSCQDSLVPNSSNKSLEKKDVTVENEEMVLKEFSKESQSNVEDSDEKEIKNESNISCSRTVADEEIEIKLLREDEKTTSLKEKGACTNESKVEEEAVSIETSPIRNEISSPVLEIPVSNSADVSLSTMEEEKKKCEDVTEEVKVKRKSKKRSVEMKSPKKNKRKSSEPAGNFEESSISEELHLADVIKLIEKSKQVPSTKENVQNDLSTEVDADKVPCEEKSVSEKPEAKDNRIVNDVKTAEDSEESTEKLKIDSKENLEEHATNEEDKPEDAPQGVSVAKNKEEVQVTNEEKNSMKITGKRNSVTEAVDQYLEIQSPIRKSSKKKSQQEEKISQISEEETMFRVESIEVTESSVNEIVSENSRGPRRKSFRTKSMIQPRNDEKTSKESESNPVLSISTIVPTENPELPLEEPSEKRENIQNEVPTQQVTLLDSIEQLEEEKEEKEDTSFKNMETQAADKEEITQNPPVNDQKESQKITEEPIVVPKVPKKRGRKKKCLIVDQTQTQGTVSQENSDSRMRTQTAALESTTTNQLPPRRSLRTSRFIEEIEDQSKNSNDLTSLQVSSASLEPFKVPEVTEVLQHTKKRTYKRKSIIDENLDTQSNCSQPEPETSNAEYPEAGRSLAGKEEQPESSCQKNSSEGKKRSFRSSTREHVDLERSSSAGSIDLIGKTEQISRTRSSKRKQLSSEDLSGQESLNQRVESADNLSETSCVSDFSYFRKKRYSKKKKLYESREDVQTDTSVTDSESVDTEKNTHRRQSLKRRAKKNISFFAEFYLMDDFDIPMDIEDCISHQETAKNDVSQELQAKPSTEQEKPVEEVISNEVFDEKPEENVEKQVEEVVENSKTPVDEEEGEEYEEDELKNEDKVDTKLDGLSQVQDDFQTPKKRTAGNYVVVHKKTGEILIVEKRKKLTKEAARFFCDVCTTSFTRKSSLKKHNQSQSHLLQMAKSKKDRTCMEDAESIEDVGQNDTSSDENRVESADEAMNVSIELKDDQKDANPPESIITQKDLEPVQTDPCYNNQLEQDSLTDSQTTHQHILEDELLDEEICKITENMSHDEYVLTDQVTPEPESTSTPIKMQIKKVEDVGKKKKHEKKKEKTKKKSSIDEQIILDNSELENSADSTLVTVLGENVSIKIAKSSHLNKTKSNLDYKDVSEGLSEDSAVSNSESKTDTPRMKEDDLKEQCSDCGPRLQENQDMDMEIKDALLRTEENTIVEKDSIYKLDSEEKTENPSRDKLDDKDNEENQSHERLSLKFTINKRSIEICKEVGSESNKSYELDYSSTFNKESEDVNCNSEKNYESECSIQVESVKSFNYSKPEIQEFNQHLNSSLCKDQKADRRSFEDIDELDASKVQNLEGESMKMTFDNESDKQGELVKTIRHGKSKKGRAKKHFEKTENSSEDKTIKSSSKSKDSPNKLVFNDVAKPSETTDDQKSFDYTETFDINEKLERLVPDSQLEDNSAKSDGIVISAILENEDDHESNELQIVEELEIGKFYPEPESLEETALKQLVQEQQVSEKKTELLENKIKYFQSMDDDEVSSSSSLADKPLSQILFEREEKLEIYKEQTKERESSTTFLKDSDKEPKPEEKQEVENSEPKVTKSDIDDNSLDTNELIDNQNSDKNWNINDEQVEQQIASEEECEPEASKTVEDSDKDSKISSESENSEAIPSIIGSGRKSSISDRQNPSKKVSRSHKYSNKDNYRKTRAKKSSIRNKIADLTSESDDSENEDKIESQNKSKIVKSVFGRVFGGEKTDKVKEVLNDWVSKSEDDSDLSRTGFKSSSSSEGKTKDSSGDKKRHSVSSSIPSSPKKRPGKRSKKSSSSDRAKEKNLTYENQATKCRLSKKRAEELISRTFEDDFTDVNADKNQKALKHKEPNYGLRNQGKPDLTIKDSGYGSFNYDEDSSKIVPLEGAIEDDQKVIKKRKLSGIRKGKGRNEEEDWRDLVAEKRVSKNPEESGDEEDNFTKVHLERDPFTSRMSVDLESSQSCSSLAPSSVRNRSPSMDRNSQTTRDSDIDGEEDQDMGHRRISPLFCGTPRSSIETSSNSENEEEEENLATNEAATRKRSSSEFSGEKIVIRSPSSSHKSEVVTIAPTDAIEDNALDVPQEIETTKPRQGKVLNFDEELFVECCSRLKATTENELRGAKKIKLDHNEGYHRKDEQQQGFRGPRDRWRDVESQNSLGSLLESVNQLLGEEMYSTRERDYPKRGCRNLRSEHSSRSASPDMSRVDNLGYEDSLDVAFEHNNKLRDKIQQRMRESENLIASTFGQKNSNEIIRGEHPSKNNEHDMLRNSYSSLQDQRHLSGTNLSNGGYNESLHVRGLQEEHGAKMNLDSSELKSKMNSSLGGLLDKALSNLLHSNEKHDHNGSTPMKVLAELACARAPTSTSGDAASQEPVQSAKTTPLNKDAPLEPNPITMSKDLQKKSRNPIKELFERKKEMNERKQQEKSKTEAALRELNVHRQRKTKKTKKHQNFPLIRRNEHGGLAERKKRRDGFERKDEFVSDRIKDVYEFDEEESQIEPNLGSVMSYRSRPGYEVSCLKTKEVDVAGLMSKAIGDTLENGKTGDALSTRLESMIDRKFKELEKFAPKTKGALKSFQSEDQQRQITGPMDEFVERKPTKAKRPMEQSLKHSKLKKRNKNPKKKTRNAWYENDSSDEYRTAVKTEDVGVGISKSQRTCSKGKQNIFAELYTSSESEYENGDANYESRRQRRVKKSNKKTTELENVEQIQKLVNKYSSDNEDNVDDWRSQDLKNDTPKHDCDNKKSESEMSDHPLIIDERKDLDEPRNSDDETENQYERNFEMDDLYREDSSIVESDVEDSAPIEPPKIAEEFRVKSPSLPGEKTDAKADYMQESERELIPLEEALDLLDQADNENSLSARYCEAIRPAKPEEHINPVTTTEPENETSNPIEDSDPLPAAKSSTPIEEQEEEPDNDLLALPEKLSSNEKPQKESENLPLHVFLSRKVQESKKKKEQQLKKMQEEQERILMDFQPTRRQRKCAIGKQGLLAEISSSDEEISPKDRKMSDKSDHDKPRKQKRESKEKRKERYIEKKHEQMIAKEQKAIEEEILREVGKKKECLAQNITDAKNTTDMNGTKKAENTELTENKMPQEAAQKKKHQTKEKQKKQSKTDEDMFTKNNHEGLSDLENNCNKSTLMETNHEIQNNQESLVKQKKYSKSPTKPKKASKSDQKITAGRKNKNSNTDRKNRADSKGSKDKERRSSSGKRDSDDEELKTTKSWNKVEEGVGVAIGRRKRAAANQLYYWSSSSDEEEMLEVVPAVEEEEDDRQEQHGWIVGDSHKRMITMLAMEKQLKEKRRRSEDEFEPGRTKSKKHRNSTS
ncbi:uncharacterized protein LOC122576484 isoform X2 [Bombus pyrosoma]|uniref:uncharacterized protein LOC122576484 isoform X2 n=1 Tax=Bombus pyrosoma TaxID=396416 RepID=UPI001CB97B66|nr:uncharacterized protein LOC122576484 isoform X2 [Bombus pyrosoma]